MTTEIYLNAKWSNCNYFRKCDDNFLYILDSKNFFLMGLDYIEELNFIH